MNYVFNLKIVFVGFLIFISTQELMAKGLQEVLREALDTNVQISAAKKNLESQLEVINQLGSQKRPSISANFSGQRDFDLNSDDMSNSFVAGITARYLLFDGNVTDHQIMAEALRIEALEAEFQGVRQKIIYEAILAYLNVLRDSTLVELSKKNVDVLSKQFDATISRFQLGELTRTDLAQAQAALEAATSILASREGILYLAQRTFETAVGVKPVDLDSKVTLPKLPQTEHEAKEIAAKFNPQLKMTLLLERRSEALLKASKSKIWPTLNFSASLTGGETPAQQEFSNLGVSLNGSVPLYSGGTQQSEERKAQLDLEVSMVNTEISRLQVQQNVVTSWSDYQVSSTVISARTREVEATELAYQGTMEEARLGARTVLDVLNAEQTVMNAQTNLETAKRNRLAAGFRLLYEMGTLTPLGLGLDAQ